ncbi:hypothetical protein [Halochromatium sp.]
MLDDIGLVGCSSCFADAFPEAADLDGGVFASDAALDTFLGSSAGLTLAPTLAAGLGVEAGASVADSSAVMVVVGAWRLLAAACLLLASACLLLASACLLLAAAGLLPAAAGLLLAAPDVFSLSAPAAAFPVGSNAGSAVVLALVAEVESDAGAAAALVLGSVAAGFVVGLVPSAFLAVAGLSASDAELAALGAASVGLVGTSGSLAVARFTPALGSAGVSALRLADALVFFVVVGFFAIAAHLRDLNASNAVCSDDCQRLAGACLAHA